LKWAETMEGDVSAVLHSGCSEAKLVSNQAVLNGEHADTYEF